MQSCTILGDPPNIRLIGRNFQVPLHPFQMIEDGEQGLHGAQELADFKRLERFDEGLIQSLISSSGALIAESRDDGFVVVDGFELWLDACRNNGQVYYCRQLSRIGLQLGRKAADRIEDFTRLHSAVLIESGNDCQASEIRLRSTQCSSSRMSRSMSGGAGRSYSHTSSVTG